jgi:hypothetical protein
MGIVSKGSVLGTSLVSQIQGALTLSPRAKTPLSLFLSLSTSQQRRRCNIHYLALPLNAWNASILLTKKMTSSLHSPFKTIYYSLLPP